MMMMTQALDFVMLSGKFNFYFNNNNSITILFAILSTQTCAKIDSSESISKPHKMLAEIRDQLTTYQEEGANKFTCLETSK